MLSAATGRCQIVQSGHARNGILWFSIYRSPIQNGIMSDFTFKNKFLKDILYLAVD